MPQNYNPCYNLVIMPDYEGYGVTRSHAHPYLYQELTARHDSLDTVGPRQAFLKVEDITWDE
jgi:hypothetical protein